MKVRLIADGFTPEDRRTENWGVSFLVGEETLFDTFGKPSRLMDNIRAFGVDLSALRRIVVSHDDWDHVSGLPDVLRINSRVAVFVCPHARREIRDLVSSAGGVTAGAGDPVEIADGLATTGEYVARCGDRVVYEQGLVVRSGDGVSLLTGCAHPGIVRMVEQIREKRGERVHCVAGGLHLKDTPEPEIVRVVSRLRELGVRKVVPVHCTGETAVRHLRAGFGENVFVPEEGAVFDI